MKSDTTNRDHPTVFVKHGNFEAEIDVLIAPLILAMWQAGIETWMSCQDFPEGYVWIQFWSADELTRFLNILREQDRDEQVLGDRICSGYNISRLAGRHQWLYESVVFDIADEAADGALQEPPNFLILLNVHIPCSDLPAITRYMNAHLSQQAVVAAIK